MNHALCALLGRSREELLQTDIWGLVDADDDSAFETRLRRLLAGVIHSFTVEHRYLKGNGEPIWVRSSVAWFDEGSASPAYVLALVEDVSEQRRVGEQLAQRERHGALAADVGAAVAAAATLDEMLQQSAEAMVSHLGAAFARVWVYDEPSQLLILRASAGQYTHLHGPHGRIPLGHLKIGRIAQDRTPHLSNQVPDDPEVSDHAWAQREAMVAFAGYPLIVEDRLVGVAALFARHRLAQDTLDALAAVAKIIATGIERKTAQEAHERLIREQAARAAAEAASRRSAFLSTASSVLASSLEYTTTLQSVARLAVPELADLCVVDMAEEDGSVRRLAAAVADREKEALAAALQRYPVDLAKPRGVPTVLRTGQSVLHPHIPQWLLTEVAQDAEHLRILEALDFSTTMLVPLRGPHRPIGVLTFVRGQTSAPYSEADLRLAEDLADRCALAIANARLFEAQREAGRRLRALSRQLVEVQEAERREIARELHDELGQALTGLRLLLEMARRAAAETRTPHSAVGGDEPPTAAPSSVLSMLADAQSTVGTLMEQVRTLSLDLRPSVLDDLGLLPAVLWHLDRYTQLTRVRITFEHSRVDRRFPPEVETAVYRIIQEALTNVARHAGVAQAHVRLWSTGEDLWVQVEDRGRGFPLEVALAAGKTAGLAGMRERPALLGGQISIESQPGSGTRVTASIPVLEAN